MSLEESILEHAAATRELGAAIRMLANVRGVPPATVSAPAAPAVEKPRSTVTDADIDKAAAETKAAAEGKAAKAARAAEAKATAKAKPVETPKVDIAEVEEEPADPEGEVAGAVDFDAVRDEARKLIHELARSQGLPAALKILAPAKRLSEVADPVLAKILADVKAALASDIG